MRSPRWRALAALTLALVACGGDLGAHRLGAFTVTVVEAEGRLRLEHDSGLRLETPTSAFASGRGRASYEMQFGSFRIEDQPIEAVSPVESLSLESASEAELVYALGSGGAGRGQLRVRVDGEAIHLVFSAPGHNRLRLSLPCDPEGPYLGFGAKTHDLDHRGQVVPVFVSEQGLGKVDTNDYPDLWFVTGTRHQSYLSVPTVLAPRAEHSYGLHLGSLYRSIWDVCATDPERLVVEAWEGTLDLRIHPGPTPKDVLRQHTDNPAVGRPGDWPDWTFGLWMEAIGGDAAVRAEVDALRRERIPVSAIWTEDFRGGRYRGMDYVLEEDWRPDDTLYPNLRGLIEAVHARGIKFMSYFNTFVVQGVDVHPEMRDAGYLVKTRSGEPYSFQAPDFETSHLADLFNPAARAFVQRELEAALDLGTDGWMADFAEWYPADPATVAETDPPAEAAHHLYPVEWARVNRDAARAKGKDADTVFFHRSGYTGAQRDIKVVWAGDQRTSFQADDGFPTVVPILLGLSMVGFPVVTHDIGGYLSLGNPPCSKDLWFRWASLGALAPVMRTHHGRAINDNWRWNRDPETIEHARRWAAFHTRLFPLWRGLADEASKTGAPILRPVVFEFPADRRQDQVMDTYMVGDALLVAPVVTASVSVRRVLLPEGRWLLLEQGELHTGPGEVDVPAPITELPVFLRAGRPVPRLPAGVESLAPTDEVLDLSEVSGAREVLALLGASGHFLEGERRYVVESAAPAPGPLTVRVGAELSRGPGWVRVRPAGDGTVEVTDGRGGVHRAEMTGPGLELGASEFELWFEEE